MKLIISIILTLLALTLTVNADCDMGSSLGGINNMMYGTGFGFGWFSWIFMVLFWAAIIWLVIWVIQQITRSKESALDILEKRYVKGEITKKQFNEMKKELK
ncbi:MAG: SHOCT domain-containing protein [Nanoarchaeota archaeon]